MAPSRTRFCALLALLVMLVMCASFAAAAPLEEDEVALLEEEEQGDLADVEDEFIETVDQRTSDLTPQARNNFINDAKNLISNIKRLGSGFSSTVNKMRDVVNMAKRLPVVGTVISSVESVAKLISNIIKLAAHFIKGGSTADNFLDRIKTAFYNLINNYKNDATLKCLYQHIKEKENMVVALALPFGASVECMQDWDCFYCVDRVQKNGPRLMIDMLNTVLGSLTEEELAEMQQLEEVSLTDQLMGETVEKESGQVVSLNDFFAEQDAVAEQEQEQEEEEEEEEEDFEEEEGEEEMAEVPEVDASELAQALYEQFSQSDSAQQAVLAEVTANAAGIVDSIRSAVDSLRSYAQTAVNYMNNVPGVSQVKSKLTSMAKRLESRFKQVVDPKTLIATFTPGGVFGVVANVIKRVPCLAKETLAGGFLFGVGMDMGGPAVTIQCRRLSCYTCLATASFSVSPFGGMAAKIVEHITSAIQAEAQEMLEETMAEYQKVQDEMLEQQRLLVQQDLEQQQEDQQLRSLVVVPVEESEDEEVEEEEEASMGFTPVATNGAWSITSALGIDWLRDRVNSGLNWVRSAAGTAWSKLRQMASYVGKVVAKAVSSLIQYIKPVINKIFSALDFVGSWSRKLASKLHDAFKRYGGCLYKELDAHNTSGGKSVGLTLVAGLDIKVTPSLSFVCNRGSCYHCIGTFRRDMMAQIAKDIDTAIGIAQMDVLQNMESAAELEFRLMEDSLEEAVESDTLEIFESLDDELEGAQWSGSIVRAVKSVVTVFGDVLTSGVKKAVEALASGIQYIKNYANSIWDNMVDGFNRLKRLSPADLWNSITSKASSIWSSLKNINLSKVVKISSKLDMLSAFWDKTYKYYKTLPESGCVRKAIDGGYIAVAIQIGAPPEAQLIGNIMGVYHCLNSPEGKQLTANIARFFKGVGGAVTTAKPAAPLKSRTANWWHSFDRKGWSTCAGGYMMNGLYRTGGHNLYNIEAAYCHSKGGTSGCRNANWWHSFDRKGWSKCPSGYAMAGLYRNTCQKIYCIESARCCKPKNGLGGCYNGNMWSSFDRKGWSRCKKGYVMTGMWRNTCHHLYCIEMFRCCQLK